MVIECDAIGHESRLPTSRGAKYFAQAGFFIELTGVEFLLLRYSFTFNWFAKLQVS